MNLNYRNIESTIPSYVCNKRKIDELGKTIVNIKKKVKRHSEDEDTESDDIFFQNDISKDVYADKNNIYFRTGVCKKSAEALIGLINDKNNEFDKLLDNDLIAKCDPSPIYLHITSFGGNVLHAFRIISCIENSKIPIYTIVDGYAASAGTMISVCGKKRYMSEHSYMLIHELSGGCWGKYKELKDDMKNSKKFMDDIEKLYTKRTNIQSKDFKRYRKHDLWWGFDRCKDLGLVDELWTE